MKKILLACGSGVCTSTAAANKLKTELEKRGKAGGQFLPVGGAGGSRQGQAAVLGVGVLLQPRL